MLKLSNIIKAIKGHKKMVLAIIVMIGIVFLIMSRNNAQKKASAIKSFTVKRVDLVEELILSGEIKAGDYAKLPFQTGGRLSYVGVKEGDVITRGKIIASLDQRQLQKNLKKELNDYKTARWNFDQEIDNNKDNAITTELQRLIDKTQFTLDNSVIDVEIQNIAIEFAHIYSPISGIVINTNNLHPGMNVTAADYFEVVNPNTLFFQVVADQTELTKIKEGMKGELVLDAYMNKPLQGTISRISFSPKKDESGTVYAVNFAFINENDGFQYRLGMTGDVTFVTDTRTQSLYVPFSYVHEEKGKKYVYTSADKKKKKTIKTGLETDTNVEITSGLQQGDVIYD